MTDPIQVEAKRYELNISEILAIPADRFDDFLFDLKKWHQAARDTVELLNSIADAIDGDQVPPEVTKMIWIDDGKHDGKIIVTTKVTDSQGGDND